MNIETLIQEKVAATALDVASVGDISLKMAVEIAAERSKEFGADSVTTLAMAGHVIETILSRLEKGGSPGKNGNGKSVELPPISPEQIGQMLRDPESYANLKNHAITIMQAIRGEAIHQKRLADEERRGIVRGKADFTPAPASFDPVTGMEADSRYPAKRSKK